MVSPGRMLGAIPCQDGTAQVAFDRAAFIALLTTLAWPAAFKANGQHHPLQAQVVQDIDEVEHDNGRSRGLYFFWTGMEMEGNTEFSVRHAEPESAQPSPLQRFPPASYYQ